MAATYEPIATTTLSSATASISFTGIANSWTDLIVVFRPIVAAATSFKVNLNNDTASNYSITRLTGDGTTAASSRTTNESFGRIGYFPAATTGLVMVHIFSYAGSTYKTLLTETSGDVNGSGALRRNVVLWRNTAAITRVDLAPLAINLESGTTATIYGIKAA